MTVTFDASRQGYSDEQVITNATITEGITIAFNKGNNALSCDYYYYGSYIRVYAGNYFTIKSNVGNITQIMFTFGSNDGTNEITKDCGTYYKNDGTWEGSSKSIKFTIGGNSGHRKLKKIAVTYAKVAPPPEVSALSITDLYSETKREYYIGETPSAEGLTVTATYKDGNTGDVTSLVSWTFEPAIIKSSTSSVTATASYGEKSAQHSYDIINKGEKEIHNYTLDMSTKSYSSSTVQSVKWDAVVASMTLNKGEGTNNANHYLGGGENKETRFYKDHKIIITPKATIHQIVFTTVASANDTYATALCNSTYTNATASKNGNTVTVTPTDGNNAISLTLNGMCGCTAMTVHYLPVVSTLTDAGYSTLCLPYNAAVPEGVAAYSASENGDYIRLTTIPGYTIAANEGVVLKGASGTYSFIATRDEANATNSNLMIGVTKDTPLTAADNAYMLTRKKEDNSVAFRRLNTDYTLGANKAYLKLKESDNARDVISVQWDDDETGIIETMAQDNNKETVIYNLSGQKLKQTQKGINIINGKLVIR